MFGGMSATPQEKIQDGFRPLVPGFAFGELNNLESFRALDRRRDGGDLRGDHPGRSRRESVHDGVPAGTAQAVRRAQPAADARRGAVRDWPHGTFLCLRAPRRHARRDRHGEGAGRRIPDRGDLDTATAHADLFTPGSHGYDLWRHAARLRGGTGGARRSSSGNICSKTSRSNGARLHCGTGRTGTRISRKR